jgi:ADP-ribosyl-[dinitrogen reductase] hydrolase
MERSRLETLLGVATDAAVRAGRQIRSEFHRAGGPRGEGSKAPIDVRVERELRETLLAASGAGVGFLGEELGYAGPEGASALWVVDPHDGTSAFLRGFRGSSVSIALVEGGVAVLGVVFAPCAPDDDGDLFAWCEGSALTRNGAVVRREPLPTQLASDVLVAVSQDADRAPEANESCVRPARYRSVASIAYRLALVASGDVDAAVSLAGVTWWDIAAGHALLRAVGATLVDGHGEPVRYEGERRAFDVFAGSEPVAKALSAAPFERVRERRTPGELATKYPRVWPVTGWSVRDADVLARAQGCWLGQLCGDSLGGLVEFLDAGTIAHANPGGVRSLRDGGTWNTLAGQPTDDSEMALMLARTLVRDGRYEAERVFEAYRDWLGSSPFDLGMTTRNALTGHLSATSQANGALMRCSPLALWDLFGTTDDARDALARRDATQTHPHSNCRDASAVFVHAASAAVREGLDREETFARALAWAEAKSEGEDVRAALERARRGPPEDFMSKQGWVLIALQNAFYRLLHCESFEQGVVETVAAGGDTDTNAAIAGALLGAVHGREGVARAWRRAVMGCRPIAGGGAVKQPRPEPFWPVDAMELAERLVLGPRMRASG